jgi:hypothetical protein
MRLDERASPMHDSSLRNMRRFFDNYLEKGDCVLDVGSKKYLDHSTYRDILPPIRNVKYTGLDIEDGENVDIIVNDIYHWSDISDRTYDLVISGQTFEHISFFWMTFQEMVRITKLRGKICVIAPSKGGIHRYPIDCWRFYPDGMKALASYANVELLESYIDPASEVWGDCVGIFER